MPPLTLRLEVEKLRLAAPFRISGFVFEEQDVLVATLHDGVHAGRGEASGVYYLGDTAKSMVAAIEAQRGAIEAGIDRASLQRLLPPAARAMHWTAHCGNSNRAAHGHRSGSSPGCRRRRRWSRRSPSAPTIPR